MVLLAALLILAPPGPSARGASPSPPLVVPAEETQTPRERAVEARPAARIRAEAALRPLAWSEIVRHRGALLGAEVRLVVQLQGRPERWNPYLGRFGPAQYVQLAGWADEQKPWEPWDYENPAVRVFVRRDGALDQALAGARTYARYELRALVREVFAERPWLEVVRAKALPERLEEGAVIHAARGWELAAQGGWSLAAEELSRALAGDPPPLARAELERLLGACRAEIEARSPAGRRAAERAEAPLGAR